MAEKVNFAELQLGQKLGAGAGGMVRKAEWREKEVAVKVYDIMNKNHKQTAEREIAQLSQIDHENIVKVYGMTNDDDNAYLLMEYVEEGSLYDFLHGDAQREYTMEEAVRWAQQCVKALVHLHSKEPRPVLHRDIKPQNMLLADGGLKICDFGTATDLATYLTNWKGTPAYMAPEVYRGEKYTEKCDVYSFGVMLWQIMSRQLPFSHLENRENPYAVLGAAEKGERPLLDAVRDDCWKGIRQLITRCWDKDPARRPSAKQILDYLGNLGAKVNYEDFIQVLDGDAVRDDCLEGINQVLDGDAVRDDCWEGIRQLINRCLDKDPARQPSSKQIEDYLGNLGATVNYEDFIQVLDGDTVAVITFHKDVMRIDFWRQQDRTIRLTVPIVERETVASVLGREIARAAHDGEREVRRAEKDAEREISRAAGDTGREMTRAGKDVEREVRQAAKNVEGAVRKMKKFRF